MQELISLFLHGGFGHSSYVGHRGGGGKKNKKKHLFRTTAHSHILQHLAVHTGGINLRTHMTTKWRHHTWLSGS